MHAVFTCIDVDPPILSVYDEMFTGNLTSTKYDTLNTSRPNITLYRTQHNNDTGGATLVDHEDTPYL